MAKQNYISRIWYIIEKTRVGMLTTQFGGGLRARPLESRVDRDAGLIWFVTDVRGAKDDEIEVAHDIGFVLIDADGRTYFSITGRASVTRDTAKAKEIWQKTDDIWLTGGPDDPNMRGALRRADQGRTMGRVVERGGCSFEFAKARLTGEKPNLGKTRKVTVPMR